MKIYNFSPKEHGQQYSVLADNTIQALEYIKEFLLKEKSDDFEYFNNVKINDENTFPHHYIFIYGIGEVMHTEIC